MLISSDMAGRLMEQTGHEIEASLQYLEIAAYMDNANLRKLAELFYKQAQEERDHALKLVGYLVKTGAAVRIPAIAETRHDLASVEQAVQLALEWEVEMARRYDALMDAAVSAKDYASQGFLAWFVAEQVEEVASMERLLDVVRKAGNNLLMVEAYLVHGE